MDIVLVANSPGELSALVKPIAEKFREKLPKDRIILFLTPCQYVSGKEMDFAQKTLEVDEIIPVSEYLKWVRGVQLPVTFSGQGMVLFLGGDLLHATVISKKLGYPAYAYLANRRIGLKPFFKRFFVPEENSFKKNDKIEVVGDLMSDSVKVLPKAEARDKWHLKAHCPTLAFLPGSRKWEIECMLPLYEKIIKAIRARALSIQTMLIVSPFMGMEEIEKHPSHHSFDVFAPFDSISASDLVITIPGTNTAQIATAGLPMLVIFPLDQPERVPLEGILHYITLIPILGFVIKKTMAYIVNQTTKFFALPNMKAGHEIVPEMRGKIDPKAAASKILDLLSDQGRLRKMSHELEKVMIRPHASQKIVERMINENVS